MEWEWVALSVVLTIHDRQLSEFGGGIPGIKDAGDLESGVMHPRNMAGYYPDTGIAALAAAYAVRLAKNHGFNDGNKRTSLAVTALFLELNGFEFTPDVDESVSVPIWLRIADGSLSEDDLARWIHSHIKPLA
jgi:death on curing protein